MSTDPTICSQDYDSQLLDLESQLGETLSDASLRQEVFMSIRRLLRERRDGERDIRRLLSKRSDTGQMRKETVQVVEKMLEHALSDMPEAAADPGDTVVLAPDLELVDEMTSEQTRQLEQPEPGTVLRERYLLQKQVSGGSMGVVFKALDRRLAEVESDEPWVAIKVLTPKLSRSAEALKALQQEASKGRCLTHANIVRFIDLDREGDTYFIVMEWIEGRSLAQILDDPDVQKLGQAQALAIAQQLGEALEYAHQCGVVHADVKPANVMMKSDGQVKLIDFGIARVRQQHSPKPGEFDPKVLGAATPAYSSMQVLTGEDPAPADDVFSLACLVYRMIAGYRVYGPRNAREAAEEGMSPQQPHGLGDAPWKVLKKALSFARVARYASPREFIDDLAMACREDKETPIRAPRRNLGELEPSKSRLPWVAALLLVLGLGAAGAWRSGMIDLPGMLAGLRPVEQSAATRIPETPPAEQPAVAPEAAVADEVPGGTPVVESDMPADIDRQGGEDVSEIAGTEAVAPGPGAESTPDTEVPTLSVAPDEIDAGAAGSESPDPGMRPTPAGATELPAPDAEALSEDPAAVDAGAGESASERIEPEFEAVPESLPEPTLGEATHRLLLATPASSAGSRLDLTIRENGPDAIIDIVRQDADTELELVVEETEFSGNRTDLGTRQYGLSNGGWIRFGENQDVSQLGIYMTPDPLREADLTALLMIRNADTGDVVGALDVILEDDDQRAFEANIEPNTVGFAVSQVSVDEDQAAAQIDLLRYRPDDSPLEVAFMVQDVTATQNQDFFAPAAEKVLFAPNERSARILVPLVQDSAVEGDEAFFIELIVPSARQDVEIFRRIAVMIRDDDS